MLKLLMRHLVALMLVGTSLFNQAWAQCSSDYFGLVAINEIHRSGNNTRFVELKILNPNITRAQYDQWTLSICSAGNKGGCTGDISLSQADDSNPPWITIPLSLISSQNYINLSGGTDVILKDGSGHTIDYVSIAGYQPQRDTSCTPSVDWQAAATNTHTIARQPDGIGDWQNKSGNSGNNTEQDNNNGNNITGPDASISDATVSQGQTAQVTVNLSAAFGSNLSFSYQTIDNSAIAGVDYTAVSGTFTIPAGETSYTLNIATIYTGSATESRFFVQLNSASNANIIGQTGVVTITPFSPVPVDHYHLSHSGIGVTCEAVTVTLTAHDAAHNVFAVQQDTVITLTTTPAVEGILSSPVTLAAGQSSVTVDLQQSTALSDIDIDVSDGSATEIEGDADHDPRLTFVDAGLLFYADGNYNQIGTQISGKPSNMASGAQLITVREVSTAPSGGCAASIQGSKNVGFAYQCENPTTCADTNNKVHITGNAATQSVMGFDGAPSGYTEVSLEFDANGEAEFVLQYDDAGQISLHAQLNVAASGSDPAFTLNGTSNSFVVRPFGFDASFDASLNPYALSETDPVFVKAGEDFDLDLRAVLWQAADDTNNDGQSDPGTDLSDNVTAENFGNESSTNSFVFSHSRVLPNPGVEGDFSALPPVKTATGTVSTIANWDEVGIIDLQVALQDYLGDSLADSLTFIQNVGRFIPDHFEVAGNNGEFLEPCDGVLYDFGYIGQPFYYDALAALPSVSITPVNVGGEQTLNYFQTGFLKLNASNIHGSRQYPTEDNLAKDINTNPMLVSVVAQNGSLALNGAELVYEFNALDEFIYTKSNDAQVIPFTSDLTIQVNAFQDSDAVQSVGTVELTPGSIEQRYGRWRMENVFGPETEALTMPGQTEYFDGAAYQLNIGDDCTNIAQAGVNTALIDSSPAGTHAIGGISGITVAGGSTDFNYNAELDAGAGDFTFSAPGSGNTGVVDISLDLSNTPWLRYDWNGDGSLEDHPDVSATFGQFRGHDRIIYWREIQP